MKLTEYLQDGADGASRIILMRLQDWELNCNVERYSNEACQGYTLTNSANTVIFYYNPNTDNIDVLVSFEDENGELVKFQKLYDTSNNGILSTAFYIADVFR